MLKRCYSLIVLILFLTGCVHHGQRPLSVKAEPVAATKTTRYIKATEFNQVDIQGHINVSLHTGYRNPQVVLKGDPRDLAYVQAKFIGGTLYLVLGSGYPRFGEVSVDIQTRVLNKFKYLGAGVIRGTQLNSSYLELYLDNQGTTQLGGYLSLRKLYINGGGLTQINGINSPYLEIYFKGDPKVQLTGIANISKLNMEAGWLSFYWVKSDILTIRARKAAKIQLAGVVNRLDVELWGNSKFKGRYLRAQRSFVKTHGKSVAEISSVNHQSTLATDASDIYYYNLSKTRADFMGFNGSVLDMRDWNNSFIKDFDTFNKQFP
ncbi:MAG: DUF2807 domain-containing protein [Legionella sp.]|jgi:hypothetical protein